jgi:hypothetical protein
MDLPPPARLETLAALIPRVPIGLDSAKYETIFML